MRGGVWCHSFAKILRSDWFNVTGADSVCGGAYPISCHDSGRTKRSIGRDDRTQSGLQFRRSIECSDRRRPRLPSGRGGNGTRIAQVPTAAAPPAASAQAPAAVERAGSSCPGNPDALGISRVVEIDTTGGPGFGFEHFKTHDFLREGEVVLTFDDGPWPKNTQAVLAALAANCTKAIFFPIGLHATYEPAILKQVAAAGHAIGSHTWCHQDLSKTKGTCLVNGKRESVEYDPKDEIEKGISAVHWAVGGATAPYFRFPALKQPPELIEYLGKRNIGISPPTSIPSTSRCASLSRSGRQCWRS